MKTSLFLASLLSLIGCSSPKSLKTPAWDKIVNDTLAFWKAPGCAISIVQGDQVLLCKGYGTKQVGSDNPIDSHTRFPIASITKLFTAIAFGILCDHGKMTLDTSIIDVYPALKLSDPYATSHLTFRDCLAMRSGLPASWADPSLYDDLNATREKLLSNALPSLPFSKGFRSHFAYQNVLYLLVEEAFKPSYQTFVKENLISPLQMQDTLFSLSELQNSPNKITPHLWKNGSFEEVSFEPIDTYLAAAGLSSSAEDMSHFLSFLLHHGSYRSKSILSSSALAEIFTPQTVASVEEFTGDSTSGNFLFPHAQFLTYGLGSFVHDYRGICVIQVPGQVDGVNCVLALVPSLELGLFVAANVESAAFTRALLFQLIDSFLDQQTDWNRQFFQLTKNI